MENVESSYEVEPLSFRQYLRHSLHSRSVSSSSKASSMSSKHVARSAPRSPRASLMRSIHAARFVSTSSRASMWEPGHTRSVSTSSRASSMNSIHTARSVSTSSRQSMCEPSHTRSVSTSSRQSMCEPSHTRSVSTSSRASHTSTIRSARSVSTSSLSSLLDSRAIIGAEDLARGSGIFERYTPVLEGRMHHFTTIENRAKIEESGILRGGFPFSKYDGRLKYPDAPRRIFFTLQRDEDGVHFPFSFYPSDADEGSRTACASVDLRALLSSDEFTPYFSNSSLARVSSGQAMQAHTQLVFAPREFVAFADAHLTRIPPSDNGILFLDESGVPQIATRIAARAFPSLDPTRSPCSNSVDIVVLGDLPLPNDGDHIWRTSHRLMRLDADNKTGLRRVECPVCKVSLSDLSYLKKHYRASHTDFRFECTVDGCTYTNSWKHHIKDHIAVKHEGFRWRCHRAGCYFVTGEARRIELHIARFHTELSRIACKTEDCKFSTFSPQRLEAHVALRHTDSVTNGFKCTQCGFATTSRTKLAEHERYEHNDGVLSCPFAGCDYQSRFKSSVKRHMRSRKHSRGASHVCLQCGHESKSMEALVAHARSSHGRSKKMTAE